MRKIIIVGFFFICFINSYAQDNELGKKVKIFSKYKTVLSRADKLDYKPIIKDTVIKQSTFEYFLKAKRVQSFYDLTENEFPKYSIQENRDYDNNYLRLAAGNNMRFLGEYAYNNDFDGKYNWGLYLKSNSSSGEVRHNKKLRDIGIVDQTALVYISRHEDERSYGLSMSYNRYMQYYYGGLKYINSKKETKRTFSANVFYKKNFSTDIKYGLSLDYDNYTDGLSNALENYISADANLAINLDRSNLSIDLDLDYLNSKKDSDFASISLEPHFKTSLGVLNIDLGFGISQYIGSNAGFYIYPKSNIYVDIFGKALSFYTQIDGGLENNNFLNSWKENPFVLVNDSQVTYTRYSLSGGFKGRFDDLFWYNLSASYSSVDDFRSFKIKENYFEQFYSDENILRFNIEFGINIDEDLTLLTKFTNYSFSAENPSNIPSCEMLLRGKYKLSENMSFGSDLYIIGKRNTSVAVGLTDKFETKGVIYDFRLNADYSFSKNISAFVKLNNIFNQNYERWEEYPVTGINLLAGFTICF